MNIHEAVEYVNKKDAHKNQLKYDFMFEKKYALTLIASAGHKKVLDVGCAYGTMPFILRRAGMVVRAMDVLPELHSEQLFREEGIEFIEGNIETDEIKEKFDLVIFTDVLEHLCYNPLPVLKKLHRCLREGGEIIISTPCKEEDFVCDGKWCDLINWRSIPEYKDYKWEDGHHHTYYMWELKDLLKEAGFKVVYEQYIAKNNIWFLKASK